MNAQSSLPIIIDTDAGTDDMLALAYLLAQPDTNIEAITVVDGLAHPRQGAQNIKRLLYAAGRPAIPVFAGEEHPPKGSRAFPAEWRAVSDKMPGVDLPQIADPALFQPAEGFLKRRLKDTTRPVRMLALGPLTHIALVLREVPEASKTIQQLVIMGGAVLVPGNLAGGNPEKAANDVAEWNIYVDPHAASQVLKSQIEMLLMPLDATMHVPITRKFVEDFTQRDLTPLGRIVAQVLQTDLPYIDANAFFAWDPLAAMALLDFSVVKARRGSLQVITSGKNIGQTKLVKWNADFRLNIGVDADVEAFNSAFLRAFVK